MDNEARQCYFLAISAIRLVNGQRLFKPGVMKLLSKGVQVVFRSLQNIIFNILDISQGIGSLYPDVAIPGPGVNFVLRNRENDFM